MISPHQPFIRSAVNTALLNNKESVTSCSKLSSLSPPKHTANYAKVGATFLGRIA
jgi:hypothetical protein